MRVECHYEDLRQRYTEVFGPDGVTIEGMSTDLTGKGTGSLNTANPFRFVGKGDDVADTGVSELTQHDRAKALATYQADSGLRELVLQRVTSVCRESPEITELALQVRLTAGVWQGGTSVFEQR